MASAAPAGPPSFLLTPSQGEAARTLMGHVGELPVPSGDTRLLATVVTIRAARSGKGNITGSDLRALRLADPARTVGDLRALGWEVPDALLDGDPDAPSAILVPGIGISAESPLWFGLTARSRVSGWVARTISAKPLKKTSATVRTAALFLAAHCSSTLEGRLPEGLPPECREVLPELLARNFLVALTGDDFELAPAVRHLAGRTEGEPVAPPARDPGRTRSRKTADVYDPAEWERWKQSATPALTRHVAAVARCAVCRPSPGRVALAFMRSTPEPYVDNEVRVAYAAWKDEHPDRGPEAAVLTVAYRERHGHGPSYRQLCKGLGWRLPRPLGTYVVRRLLDNGWLTCTGTVPWTLRPGPAAQEHGIVLPAQQRGTAEARPVSP
ncbi:hypothetical protein [Streptomyces sp. NPDC008150]|uniref:hypothetical protein n=1 Tax=Streptomyces sp. NPDC008150 TaxID=3364816 RepID=UPI0036E5ACA7